MRKFQLLVALTVSALVLSAAQPVRAKKAMVVSREAHATDAGVAVLKAGGNAVDAAVAVGLALAVTHPSAGNIGGGGFMLARFADGRSTFIDFREMAPGRATRDMYLDAKGEPTKDSVIGWRAPGVPGTVRGLALAHEKYGKAKWKDLVAPSVKLAKEGFPVSYGLARSLKSTRSLGQFPESKRIFLKGGAFYEAGELLKQPELGVVLERIGRVGPNDFYEGETAKLFAAQMTKNGGLITFEDLKNYKAVERIPLKGKYRGFEVITAPPPSSGGIGILQMLSVLEKTKFADAGAGSAQGIHYMAEAMRRYYADRSEFLGDPDFFKVPVSKLLDKRYIDKLRASIDPSRATPSDDVKPGDLSRYESTETTHYSIVDSEGNSVAVTYTLNGGYGSGAAVPGLGFILNNEMDDFSVKPGHPNMYGAIGGEANAITPGKRPLSSMTPSIVLKDGKPLLIVGTPGGTRIITSVFEVIVNVLDFKMNVQDAVNAPRFHHQWKPDKLYIEPGISPIRNHCLPNAGICWNWSIPSVKLPLFNSKKVVGWLVLPIPVLMAKRPVTKQMRHALSTHYFVNQRLTNVALQEIWNAGIPAVEIFCARQHLDYNNKSQVQELAYWFKDAKLKLHSLHLPMHTDEIWGRSGPQAHINICETQKSKRIAMVDELKRAVEVAEYIPCTYLIQHIGGLNEEYDDRKLDAAFSSLEELSLFAKHRGAQILLENIPNSLSSAERLCSFLTMTHLNLNFCFDSGHANLMEGVEPAFEQMKSRIRSTHIHDNNGKDDTHLFPFLAEGGTIDWRRTMELLRSVEHQYPLLLELKESPDFAQPLEAIKQIFERLENL